MQLSDWRALVRRHLPPLAVAREPEIVDELAQHLADLYAEALANGRCSSSGRGRECFSCVYQSILRQLPQHPKRSAIVSPGESREGQP